MVREHQQEQLTLMELMEAIQYFQPSHQMVVVEAVPIAITTQVNLGVLEVAVVLLPITLEVVEAQVKDIQAEQHKTLKVQDMQVLSLLLQKMVKQFL